MRAEANDDGDDNDGDDAVIGLDSLPDELQSQIVEAIARSRLRDGKAEGVISTNEDGAASLFLFGNEDEEVTLEKTDSDEDDDDDQPFVVLGDRKRKQKKAKDIKKAGGEVEAAIRALDAKTDRGSLPPETIKVIKAIETLLKKMN